ncbi:MAG: TetR/AcrR family transcriptional regulator [Pseudoclavibacter sp.]
MVQSLNRDVVVGAALAITASDGLQKVTMRAVGGRLGVTPMALYRHIGGREELVRLVIDRIGAGFELPCPPDAAWDVKVRAWANAQRARLRNYPGAAAWLIDNGPAGPQAYRILDTLVSALDDGGFDDPHIARGATLVMSWTFSRIAIEDNADLRRASSRPDRTGAFVSGLAAIDPAMHPTAARIGHELFTLSMREVFEVGLESIIHGLARLE